MTIGQLRYVPASGGKAPASGQTTRNYGDEETYAHPLAPLPSSQVLVRTGLPLQKTRETRSEFTCTVSIPGAVARSDPRVLSAVPTVFITAGLSALSSPRPAIPHTATKPSTAHTRQHTRTRLCAGGTNLGFARISQQRLTILYYSSMDCTWTQTRRHPHPGTCRNQVHGRLTVRIRQTIQESLSLYNYLHNIRSLGRRRNPLDQINIDQPRMSLSQYRSSIGLGHDVQQSPGVTI